MTKSDMHFEAAFWPSLGLNEVWVCVCAHAVVRDNVRPHVTLPHVQVLVPNDVKRIVNFALKTRNLSSLA